MRRILHRTTLARLWRRLRVSLACAAASLALACGGQQAPTAPSEPTPSGPISDSSLFALVAQTEPFGSYALFPNVPEVFSVVSGHPPLNRARLNGKALAALQNGRLPPGGRFPDGSIISSNLARNATVQETGGCRRLVCAPVPRAVRVFNARVAREADSGSGE